MYIILATILPVNISKCIIVVQLNHEQENYGPLVMA